MVLISIVDPSKIYVMVSLEILLKLLGCHPELTGEALKVVYSLIVFLVFCIFDPLFHELG